MLSQNKTVGLKSFLLINFNNQLKWLSLRSDYIKQNETFLT